MRKMAAYAPSRGKSTCTAIWSRLEHVLRRQPGPPGAPRIAYMASLVYNRGMVNWKGDQALPDSKRGRARRRYRLGPCNRCGKPGVDRHHRDDNTGNNEPENVEILCRRCHMEIDGRLAIFRSTSASLRGPQPPNVCENCKRPMKPLRRGRCHACNEYRRRQGRERPYKVDGRVEKHRGHSNKSL